ncbi:DUF6196 family protein [Streptomyces sp. MST-110588]|uniref:DUF6196 family protein n=1 Tax=Streptomyces sp. MST-110588 TaxID=2833628 RepID=UPI001F5D5547|nr:DUF6196 family protein [Streptomyces sp. MST-110588]UNO43117.1 hypothetical protein KGS77_31000 [Streptomyces sp. MST-110588]
MVDVSKETPDVTEQRLRQVLAIAELKVHDGTWCYEETPLHAPPTLTPRTLAVVRDEDSWSALVPYTDDGPADRERFGLFSFHFPSGVDNSGFVGWLATHLKHRLGTGVFVVCGSNRDRGGIYDYWGCPAHLLPDAVATVKSLRANAPADIGLDAGIDVGINAEADVTANATG